MIRCLQCNSELTEQARFCNICGLPQKYQEPELEQSIRNGAETLDTNRSNQCVNCGAEIPGEARFCAICGAAQAFKKEVVVEQPSHTPATSVSKPNGQDDLTVRLQPSVAVKPSKRSKTIPGQISKESDNAPKRSKTITRAPILPSRPTNVGKKSAAAIKEAEITELSSESPRALAKSLQPNQDKVVQAVESENTDAPSDRLQSESKNQTAVESPASARTPGLIRPITAKSSSRSVIPSRPDVNEPMTSNPQQLQPTPESPILTSAGTSSAVNKQAQKQTSSVLMEPTTESRDMQQIARQATQRIQNYSQTTIDPSRTQNRSQEQIVSNRATSDKPLWQDSSSDDPDELSSRSTSVLNSNGKNSISDSPTIELMNPASFMATSNAAEQWRKSWRDRQYAEAGPAETVSRGQASVPTPLTSMQQSFLRMRAIQKSDKEYQGKRTGKLSTWITIFLMICLIIGLGAYIIISYFPNSPFAIQTYTSANNTSQPTLAFVGTGAQTITIGRSIKLRGTQFGDNQTIVFLRDTAIPIIDSNGKNISTRTDNQGVFVVTIPINTGWSVGSHSIEALDHSKNQNAFVTIQIIPKGTVSTSNAELAITTQGKSVSQLHFTNIMGQANPQPQQITITNTSGSPLQWTATASTNNNLNWLQINDNNDYGQLAISQPHDMLISVNTTGLTTTDKNHPYVGQIIFTLNNSQLLTLPVQLQIVDATSEMVFSPNPIIAQIGPGNACQSSQRNVPITLTLINLGTAAISWAVNPDLTDKIKFVNNGRLLESGTLLPSGSLLPSGQPGDTIVLTLQCNDIKLGQSYHVSVYANQLSWSESVIITKN